MSRALRQRVWHGVATWLYRLGVVLFVVMVLPVMSLAALVDELEDPKGGERADE